MDPTFVHIPHSFSWRSHSAGTSMGLGKGDVITDMAPLHYPRMPRIVGEVYDQAELQSYQILAAASSGVLDVVAKEDPFSILHHDSNNKSSSLGFELDPHHDIRGETISFCGGLQMLAVATARCTSFYSLPSHKADATCPSSPTYCPADKTSPFRRFEAQVMSDARAVNLSRGRDGQGGEGKATNAHAGVGAVKWCPLPIVVEDVQHGNDRTLVYLCASLCGGVVEVVACTRRTGISAQNPSASPAGSLPFTLKDDLGAMTSSQTLEFLRRPMGAEGAKAGAQFTFDAKEALKVCVFPHVGLSKEDLTVETFEEKTIKALDAYEAHQVGGPQRSDSKYQPKFKRSISDFFLEDKGLLQDVVWLSDRHLLVVTATTVGVVDVWDRLHEALAFTDAMLLDTVLNAAKSPKKNKSAVGKKRARKGDDEDEEEKERSGDSSGDEIRRRLTSGRKSLLVLGTVYTSIQPCEVVAIFYPFSAEHFESRSLGDRYNLTGKHNWITEDGSPILLQFIPTVNSTSCVEMGDGTATWMVAVGGITTQNYGKAAEERTMPKCYPSTTLLNPGVTFLAVSMVVNGSGSGRAFTSRYIRRWNGPAHHKGSGWLVDNFSPTALLLRRQGATQSGKDIGVTAAFQLVVCGSSLLSPEEESEALSRPPIRSRGQSQSDRTQPQSIPSRLARQRLGGYTWLLDVVFRKGLDVDDDELSLSTRSQWPIMSEGDSSPTNVDTPKILINDDILNFTIYRQDPFVRAIQPLADVSPLVPWRGMDSCDVSGNASAAAGYLLSGQYMASFVSCPQSEKGECLRPWGVVFESQPAFSIEAPETHLTPIPRTAASDIRWLSFTSPSLPVIGGGDDNDCGFAGAASFSPMSQLYADFDRNRFASLSTVASRFTLNPVQYESNARRVQKRGVGGISNCQNDPVGKRKGLLGLGGVLVMSGDGDAGRLGFKVAALPLFGYDSRFVGLWLEHSLDFQSQAAPMPTQPLPSLEASVDNLAMSLFSNSSHRDCAAFREAALPKMGLLWPSLLPTAHSNSDLLRAFAKVVYGSLCAVLSTTMKHSHDMNGRQGRAREPFVVLVSSSLTGMVDATLLDDGDGFSLRSQCGSSINAVTLASAASARPHGGILHLPVIASCFPCVTLEAPLEMATVSANVSEGYLSTMMGLPCSTSTSNHGNDRGMPSLVNPIEVVRGFLEPTHQLARMGGPVGWDASVHEQVILSELRILKEMYLRSPRLVSSGAHGGLSIHKAVNTNDGVKEGKEGLGLQLFRKYQSSTHDPHSPSIPAWEAILLRALRLTLSLSRIAASHHRAGLVEELLLGRAVALLEMHCSMAEEKKSEAQANVGKVLQAGSLCASYIMASVNRLPAISRSAVASWSGNVVTATLLPGLKMEVGVEETPSLVSRWERAARAHGKAITTPMSDIKVFMSGGGGSGILMACAQTAPGVIEQFPLDVHFNRVLEGTVTRLCTLCGQLSSLVAREGSILPDFYYPPNTRCQLCRFEFSPESPVAL